MSLYPLLLGFIEELAPTWRATRPVNRALLTPALVQRRARRRTALARAYPVPLQRRAPRPKHGLRHRVKRLGRFLHHPTLDVAAVQARRVRRSATACPVPDRWLPILVDRTSFPPCAVLAASIPHHGRALPLAWRAFRRDRGGEEALSQHHLSEDCPRAPRPTSAPGSWPVVVADRAVARAAFFRFRKQEHTHFVIRVDAATRVQHPPDTGPMGHRGRRPGQPRWLPGATHGKDERAPRNVLAGWGRGHQEPWLLASHLDDARLIAWFYRKRMRIAHGFRAGDHQPRLKGPRAVQTARRRERLLLAVIVLSW